MQRTLALVARALTLAVTAFACGGSFNTPESVLTEQLREFHGHLRWGRVDEASIFVSPEHREVFLGIHDQLGDDYQVTEYEIESVSVERAADLAVVTVWMQWFRLPSTRVEEQTFIETWSYSDDARVWQLVDRQSRR